MSARPAAAWAGRAAVALAAAALAWRVLSLGMAEFLAADDPGQALAWRPDHPQALRGLAARLEGSDPARAEALLARAYRGDPTDGQALLRLAGLWRRRGQAERADRACELAERLSPADARLRLAAAQYWLAAGKPQKTLADWDLAMQINPLLGPALFPALLDAAQAPAGLAALRPVAAALPSWWPAFFAYAAKNAARTDTVRALYALRKGGGRPFGTTEINTYLARLSREGLWAEAYMAWLNSLDAERQQALGYVFDGGFELASFQGGFDWAATAAKAVQATANYTQGATGKRALHIVFRGKGAPSPIVEQTVFLLPGRYRLSGRVRPDALQAADGLEWALECAADGARLASSERFLGSDTWREFAADFHVAGEGCAGARLRLQPVARPGDDREARGEIWFDDLAIETVGGEAPRAAPAAATRPPAKNAADSAAGTPGTPRRAPKSAPPSAP